MEEEKTQDIHLVNIANPYDLGFKIAIGMFILFPVLIFFIWLGIMILGLSIVR